jgi:hypothetical protein
MPQLKRLMIQNALHGRPQNQASTVSVVSPESSQGDSFEKKCKPEVHGKFVLHASA